MRRSWADQPPRIKVLVCALAGIQLGLLGAAHWDLSHRDAAQIRGSKGRWRAITLINFVGPIWYFARGRR
ncbi:MULTISPECIES: hypothetical protein [unclassified Pseudactinotalea]|uniref:hypothetical protein n=1 Tax=unclassified Pseudactinotalea TaxID=2649176 RepID=UPI00128B9C47|nr:MULTISPECIES: hypothetical protein [unclassified Pseudactinotalea]MPV49886.1 hypothetical protein [Pseudactinotalea sp. HY160]QGH69149.1 hypothetical protein GCE65_06230 [Pseudactinotalea sp. HY158]